MSFLAGFISGAAKANHEQQQQDLLTEQDRRKHLATWYAHQAETDTSLDATLRDQYSQAAFQIMNTPAHKKIDKQYDDPSGLRINHGKSISTKLETARQTAMQNEQERSQPHNQIHVPYDALPPEHAQTVQNLMPAASPEALSSVMSMKPGMGGNAATPGNPSVMGGASMPSQMTAPPEAPPAAVPSMQAANQGKSQPQQNDAMEMAGRQQQADEDARYAKAQALPKPPEMPYGRNIDPESLTDTRGYFHPEFAKTRDAINNQAVIQSHPELAGALGGKQQFKGSDVKAYAAAGFVPVFDPGGSGSIIAFREPRTPEELNMVQRAALENKQSGTEKNRAETEYTAGVRTDLGREQIKRTIQQTRLDAAKTITEKFKPAMMASQNAQRQQAIAIAWRNTEIKALAATNAIAAREEDADAIAQDIAETGNFGLIDSLSGTKLTAVQASLRNVYGFSHIPGKVGETDKKREAATSTADLHVTHLEELVAAHPEMVGPVIGRVQLTAQGWGIDPVPGRTPEEVQAAQEMRTEMLYLLANEVRSMFPGRPAQQIIQMFHEVSATQDKSVDILLGSLRATKSANEITRKSIAETRFGRGNAKAVEQRGTKPKQTTTTAPTTAPAGHLTKEEAMVYFRKADDGTTTDKNKIKEKARQLAKADGRSF